MDWVRFYTLSEKKQLKSKVLTVLIFLILFSTTFSQTGQGKFGVGIKSGFQYLNFDKSISSYGPNYGLKSYLKLNRYLRFEANADYISYSLNNDELYLLPLSVSFNIDNKQTDEFRFYSIIGSGALFYENSGTDWSPQVTFGFGTEYFLGNKAGLFLDLSLNHIFTDNVEGLKIDNNDNFFKLSAGFNFYFNSKEHRYITGRVKLKDYLFEKDIFQEIEKLEKDKFEDIKNMLNGVIKQNDSIQIIHKEIFEAEQGEDMYIYCRIKGDFLLPVFVFRWNKSKEWNVFKMKQLDADSLSIYGIKVDGRFVKAPKMEYFLMAVDDNLLSAGLFADKNDPVIVDVSKNKKFWFNIGKIFSIINILATGYFTIF